MGIEKTTFDEMRFMKQALVQLETRASAIRDEILDTLDDEDDVERMTLSSQATGTAKRRKKRRYKTCSSIIFSRRRRCTAPPKRCSKTRDLDESISVTLSGADSR